MNNDEEAAGIASQIIDLSSRPTEPPRSHP